MGLPVIIDEAVDLSYGLPTTGYYWATSYFDSPPPFVLKNWVYNTGLGVSPGYPIPGNLPKLVYRNTSDGYFRKNRTYQYVTQVLNYTQSGSFSLTTPWGDFIDYDYQDRFGYTTGLFLPSQTNGYLYYYSTPTTNTTSKDFITYRANRNWGLGGYGQEIAETRINEIDFDIQGFAWWKDANSGTSSTAINFSAATDGIGWTFYSDTNSYVWYDSATGSILPALKIKIGGEKSILVGTASYQNYIYKFIENSSFNLSFTFTKLSGTATDGVRVYLSQEKPDDNLTVLINENNLPSTAVLIATYTQSTTTQTYGLGSTFSQYFGLVGKQYLIFQANKTSTSTTLAISDITVSGGYWSGNNRRYLTMNGNNFQNPSTIIPIGLTGATFTAFAGTGNTFNATQSLDVQQIFSKLGNGKFQSGIWENGVWNSGWRFDDNVYELYEIGRYFNTDRGKIWRFQIIGPESTISKFTTGDKVSLGNIVAIDFNESRKLLKGYFTILAKNSNSIIVELINNFPLKRIEKDSIYHRITITKNVWLAGVFLNGYYKGIWNSGLFKGYPLITEMFDSNWIDGTFDGGHFSSKLYSVTFSNTFFVKGNKLGLSFSQPHKLNTGDQIYIDKTNKLLNPTYDGTSSVLSITDEYQLIVDKDFVSLGTESETGTIYTNISSGLVQNFTFKSNNKSKLSSVDFLDSDAVFTYNSWMDVNFYTYSAVNIGRPQTLRNLLSNEEYSSNNLYGYPTDDVLSSISTFRNSYNNSSVDYNLGTKYKIFNDFIGEASKFETFFKPTNVDPTKFLELGWTYSSAGLNSIIFRRSLESKASNRSRNGLPEWINIREDLLVGSELQIDAIAAGGVLNLVEPIEVTNFRKQDKVAKGRYTIVEFDLARWSGVSAWYGYEGDGSTKKIISPELTEPILHFDNINTVVRDVLFYATTYSVTVEASFLPVYKNVNHLLTTAPKKVEYFYNKTNLSLNLRGSGFYGSSTASILIDNLKYYEVDMIPFFQYFTRENINFGIEIPYQGIAPFIDYSNANFQFLDNVSIGLDSFAVNASNVAVSGVGAGIGLAGYGGGTLNNPFNNPFDDISGPEVIDILD